MQRPRPLITISRPLLQRLSALLAVLALVAASVFGIRLVGGSALGERIMAALPKRTPAMETGADLVAASARNGADTVAGQGAQGAAPAQVGADFAPAIKVLKTLTTQNPTRVGQEVGFRIELRNVSHLPLADLAVVDTYDAAHLRFLSAQPAPTEVDENSGTLSWSALEAQLDDGSLDQADIVVVDVRFIALAPSDNGDTRNQAAVSANGGHVTDGPHAALVRIDDIPVANLCLGDMVFVDLADDGRLDPDAGDLGIGGVALSLYSDADGDDAWSEADPLLRTTRSDSDGRYGFCDLAPGDYLVLVEPVNFAADGPLAGLRSSGAGTGADRAVDPDDDVDGDDNGGAAGPTDDPTAEPPPVVSRAITLTADGEPSMLLDGTGVGDNRTLDLGFAMREGIGSGSPDPLVEPPSEPEPVSTAPEAPQVLRDPAPVYGKPVYGKPLYGKPRTEQPRRP